MRKLPQILGLAVLPLMMYAGDETALFTPECLASFPEAEFRAGTESVYQTIRKQDAERARIVETIKKSGSFRATALEKRAEILENLLQYMRRNLDSKDRGRLLLAWAAVDQAKYLADNFSEEYTLWESQQKFPESAKKVYDVKKYGAVGDGKNDDGPAIRKAIDDAVNSGTPAKIFLPKGVYRITPKNYALKNYRSAMNKGSATTWEIKKFSVAHLLVANGKQLTIAGEPGTKLVFTDPTVAGIRLLGSYNTHIRDLVLDYENLPFTQGKIVGVLPKTNQIEIEIDKGFASPMMANLLKAPSRRITPIDPKTKNFYPQTFPIGKVSAGGKNRFLVEVKSFRAGTSRGNLQAGNLFVITGRYDAAQSTMISSFLSKFDEFERITIHSSPSFNYKFKCDAPILKNCSVIPASGRLMSSNADGCMHWDPHVGPCLENCRFESMEDDGINITANVSPLTEVAPDGKTSSPGWVMNSSSGIMVIDGNTCKIKAAARIIRKNGKLIYDPALPVSQIQTRNSLKQAQKHDGELENHYRKNKIMRPDYVLRTGASWGGTCLLNCTYHNLRGLGIQLTAPSVLVENCTIDTTTGPGVAITMLCPWNMYFSSYNAIVRNNTIKNTHAAAINLKAIPPYSDGKIYVKAINSILIEGNRLHTKSGRPLVVENGFDITVKNNTGLNGEKLP